MNERSKGIDPRDSPKVSAILPVYNGERYLREAMDSILGQTFTDFELIVVNDGSSDGTNSILASYGDRRVRVLDRPHAGLVPALNLGVLAARGEYLARMDADDRSAPDRFARQVAALDSDPKVAVVTGEVERMDESGAPLGLHPRFNPDELLFELAAGNPVVHGSVMCRRELLPAVPYGEAPEDYRLWIELAKQGRPFAYLEGCIYYFREHRQRHSQVHARSQSLGSLRLQGPLLDELSSKEMTPFDRRFGLVLLGWARLASSAYIAQDTEISRHAIDKLFAMLQKAPLPETADEVRSGIQSILWARCPFWIAIRLLLWRIYHQPREKTAWIDLVNYFKSLASRKKRQK